MDQQTKKSSKRFTRTCLIFKEKDTQCKGKRNPAKRTNDLSTPCNSKNWLRGYMSYHESFVYIFMSVSGLLLDRYMAEYGRLVVWWVYIYTLFIIIFYVATFITSTAPEQPTQLRQDSL